MKVETVEQEEFEMIVGKVKPGQETE